jgi:hypothetical protein
MTYQQYKDELAEINDMVNSLWGAFQVMELAGGGWHTPATNSHTNVRCQHILTDIKALRQYRGRLVNWFMNSRIGNSPVVR